MHNESPWCIPSHQMEPAVTPTEGLALLHSLPLKLYFCLPSLVCPPAFYICLAIFVMLSPSCQINIAQIGSVVYETLPSPLMLHPFLDTQVPPCPHHLHCHWAMPMPFFSVHWHFMHFWQYFLVSWPWLHNCVPLSALFPAFKAACFWCCL